MDGHGVGAVREIDRRQHDLIARIGKHGFLAGRRRVNEG
jgi:hypothetical protein